MNTWVEKLRFLLIPSRFNSWLMEAGHGKATPQLEGLPGAGGAGRVSKESESGLEAPQGH